MMTDINLSGQSDLRIEQHCGIKSIISRFKSVLFLFVEVATMFSVCRVLPSFLLHSGPCDCIFVGNLM